MQPAIPHIVPQTFEDPLRFFLSRSLEIYGDEFSRGLSSLASLLLAPLPKDGRIDCFLCRICRFGCLEGNEDGGIQENDLATQRGLGCSFTSLYFLQGNALPLCRLFHLKRLHAFTWGFPASLLLCGEKFITRHESDVVAIHHPSSKTCTFSPLCAASPSGS
jgi:hypothetical protein